MDVKKSEKIVTPSTTRKDKMSPPHASSNNPHHHQQQQQQSSEVNNHHPTSNINNGSSNHHTTITPTISSSNSKKDTVSVKKEKSLSSRHAHYLQQGAANGSSAFGKSSTNGSSPSGKTTNSNQHQYNNETPRKSTVSRERSFMRSQSNANNNIAYNSSGNTQHQTTGGSVGGRVVTVQRQRSCVANLYANSHGRSTSVTAMPAATAAAYQRPKPAMQLYRPPTLRVSDDYAMMNGSYAYEVASNGNGTECSTSLFNKAGLNINAKEFVSLSSNGTSNGNVVGYTTSGVSFSGPNGLTPSALKHSKSSSQVLNGGGRSNGTVGLHHSRSSSVYFGGGSAGHHGGSRVSGKDGRNGSSGGVTGSSPPLRVHFTDDTTTYDPDNKAGMIQRSPPNSNNNNYLLSAAALQILPIKRSKSLGSAADLIQQQQLAGGGGLLHSPVESASATNATNAINDMAPFSDDLTAKLHQLLHAPNAASARVVMEVVRQLFNKLIQGSRYAEPAARYCIAVIEKESGGETFLETLLNTCQEYYQERDRLLRTPAVATPTRPGSSSPPQTHTRWVSYMTFLHEMYTQVKRRQRTVVSSTGPGLLLLTLLAECCVVSLDDQAKGGASMTQTECLFFILTGVGKDIELELPPLMSKVMGSARDALFTSAKVPAVRKTLLQLIEMNAASWALPAPAVMYYYPGVAGK